MSPRKERVTERSTAKRRMSDIRLPKKETKTKTKAKSSGKAKAKKSTRSSYRSQSIERYELRRSPGTRLLRFFGVLFVAAALVLVVGAFVFGKAHVLVTPHVVQGNVNTLVATSDTPAPGVDLVYQTMRIERSVSQRVQVHSFDTQEQRASVAVTIYNTGSAPQDLVEETRFETNGLIYKLPKGDGVRIPAANGTEPGSVEAVVYADKPGAEYNLSARSSEIKFVIPGWREIGSPKFETQYARAFESITGGGEGRIPVIDDEQKAHVLDELETQLAEQLLAQADAQAPEQFIFFRDASHIQMGAPQTEIITTNGAHYAEITLAGTFEALLFDEDEIGRILGRFISDEYAGEDVTITNPQDLTLGLGSLRGKLGWGGEDVREQDPAPQEGGEDESGPDETSVGQVQGHDTLHITGEPHIEMIIDTAELAGVLAGARISKLGDYFQSSPAIRDAQITVRPFWKMKVPKASRITIVVAPGE